MLRFLPITLALACDPKPSEPADTDAPADDLLCPAGEADVQERTQALLSQMTLEQKVQQMAGGGVAAPVGTWGVRGVDELGVPGLVMVDGPRGVSRTAATATAFPVASARGATWDPNLELRVGEAIGREIRAVGASVVLAPTINVLRHPAWGRAQETYGEEPAHIGDLGAAFVQGAQQHVMASAKHLAANSIEDTRFDVDVTVPPRALREVYLPAFKQSVDVGVASIMSAYNSVNGAYSGENEPILRTILKEEWGFLGFVESDWVWGTYSTAPSANAGLDLEMPVANWYGDKLLQAVQDGLVSEDVIDEAVGRLVRAQLCYRMDSEPPEVMPEVLTQPEHVALAREVAERATVLLKNDGILPLESSEITRLAVVGPLADLENIGDDGSSAVAPPYVVTVLDGLTEALGEDKIWHAPGVTLDSDAVTELESADAAVVVVGLTSAEEGEGFIAAGDRTTLAIPPEQEQLILDVVAAQPKTIVVLQGGSAVTTEAWIDAVPAVWMAWYPGMEGGHAIADLMLGQAEPSGRLPVTFPRELEQLPVFDNVSLSVDYDLWHGYRHMLREGTSPRFPFGYGGSYTTWALSNAGLASDSVAAGMTATVSVTVENTGDRPGIQTVQVYAAAPDASLERPPRWLVGFAQALVEPGESKQVKVEIPTERLAAWDETANAWTYEPEQFEIWSGTSSADVTLVDTLSITAAE